MTRPMRGTCLLCLSNVFQLVLIAKLGTHCWTEAVSAVAPNQKKSVISRKIGNVLIVGEALPVGKSTLTHVWHFVNNLHTSKLWPSEARILINLSLVRRCSKRTNVVPLGVELLDNFDRSIRIGTPEKVIQSFIQKWNIKRCLIVWREAWACVTSAGLSYYYTNDFVEQSDASHVWLNRFTGPTLFLHVAIFLLRGQFSVERKVIARYCNLINMSPSQKYSLCFPFPHSKAFTCPKTR